MAIIGKYNLQDFNIDKKDLNKKFFKNSENEYLIFLMVLKNIFLILIIVWKKTKLELFC